MQKKIVTILFIFCGWGGGPLTRPGPGARGFLIRPWCYNMSVTKWIRACNYFLPPLFIPGISCSYVFNTKEQFSFLFVVVKAVSVLISFKRWSIAVIWSYTISLQGRELYVKWLKLPKMINSTDGSPSFIHRFVHVHFHSRWDEVWPSLSGWKAGGLSAPRPALCASYRALLPFTFQLKKGAFRK